MALTLEAAETAGQIAVAIRLADSAIAALQARIDDSSQIVSMAAQLATGANVRAECPMTAEESATVFAALKTVVQAKKTDLEAALAAVGT